MVYRKWYEEMMVLRGVIMKGHKSQAAILMVFIVSCICGCKLSTESQFKFDYPLLNDVSRETSLSCEAKVYSGIWGESKKIEAQVLKGTDKLAITINGDDTLSLMTEASVKAGVTEPAKFEILENNGMTLLAIQRVESRGAPSINTFVLDKKSGLAIWSKSAPRYPTLDKPVGQIIYLSCK
jgi:hypothetical protein